MFWKNFHLTCADCVLPVKQKVISSWLTGPYAKIRRQSHTELVNKHKRLTFVVSPRLKFLYLIHSVHTASLRFNRCLYMQKRIRRLFTFIWDISGKNKQWSIKKYSIIAYGFIIHSCFLLSHSGYANRN